MSDVIDRMGKGLFQKDQMLTGNPPPMMVILGDHGMSDDKGHGGSSAPEATTPLIFIPKPQVWSVTRLWLVLFVLVGVLGPLHNIPDGVIAAILVDAR